MTHDQAVQFLLLFSFMIFGGCIGAFVCRYEHTEPKIMGILMGAVLSLVGFFVAELFFDALRAL